MSIDALLGQGALAALISGAARKSATPQQTQTPPPPPAPAGIPPSAAAVIAAALRSPRVGEPLPLPRPVAPVPVQQPVGAGATAGDPSALLAMLRQSGLIKTAPMPAAAGGTGALSLGSLKRYVYLTIGDDHRHGNKD